MCGIAGYISADYSDHRLDITRMLSAIEHRGPNGQGIFSEPGITLGHRRLAILDLSDLGKQPMVRGNLVIVHNGEIYNYIELRDELEKKGYIHASQTDTEVILSAYSEWGPKCVEHFEGMWAFAIFDRINNHLFCSRDRFGEKPFFYFHDKNRFIFFSEPRQLRVLGLGQYANLDRVSQYLLGDGVASPDNVYFRDVAVIPPGSNLLLDLKSLDLEVRRYYKPGTLGIFSGVEEDQVPSLFESELKRSIGLRLRSDVPVGLLLSGGIDSSLIAAIAGPMYRDASGHKLRAVTSVAGNTTVDESEYAKLVSECCGLDWVCVNSEAYKIGRLWHEATKVQERPLSSGSVVAQMLAMNGAKDAGITVLLDGQGADETWLGYPRYIVPALKMLPPRRRLAIGLKNIDKSGLGISNWIKVYLYFRSSMVRELRAKKIWKKHGLAGKFPVTSGGVFAEFDQSKLSLRDLQCSELQGVQLGRLLHYEDRNSMAYSLESRLPFLSHRLVELSLSTPIELMFKEGWAKWPLRNLLAHMVPERIAWRKRKIGFEVDGKSFDMTDHKVKSLIDESQVLPACGFIHRNISSMSRTVALRLYSVAVWEQVCKVRV